MKMLELRIPPPLVSLLFAGLMYGVAWFAPVGEYVFQNPVIQYGLVALFLLMAFFFMGAGVGSFRKAKTTVNPLKPELASQLVSSGVYKITRNPMYLGMVLILLAWSIYLANIFSILVVVAFIAYITLFQIKPEEKAMEKLFGEDFKAYCNSTRRWC